MNDSSLSLPYGKRSIPFSFPPEWSIQRLNPGGSASNPPLNPKDLAHHIRNDLIPSIRDVFPTFPEDLVIAIPDQTRKAGQKFVVSELLPLLENEAESSLRIRILVGSGKHRPPNSGQLEDLVGEDVRNRSDVTVIVHNAYDPDGLEEVGVSVNQTPVRLNRALLETDCIICYGQVKFHYLAGFGGGEKMVCPGLAGMDSITAVHKKTLPRRKKTGRGSRVEAGLLRGNPMRDAIESVCEADDLPPLFGVQSVVTPDGKIRGVSSGPLQEAHRNAVQMCRTEFEVSVEVSPDILVVSPGGYPDDIDLIQSHKSLQHIRSLMTDHQTVVLVAECRDGFGSDEFRHWLQQGDAGEISTRLHKSFEVYGQTAMALKEIAQQVDLRILTDLTENLLKEQGVRMYSDVKRLQSDLVEQHNSDGTSVLLISGGSEYLFRRN